MAKLTSLDLWIGADEASAYRRRRREGVRLPLTGDVGDLRTYAVIIALISSAVIGAPLLIGRGGWLAAFGVALASALVVAVVSMVRYLRLPTDPDPGRS